MAADFIDWSALSNPVLAYEDWSIKDFACAHRDGTFSVFFSAFYADRGRVRSHVVGVDTENFSTYSAPTLHLDGAGANWYGMASPDLTAHGGRYYLTYNSWGDRERKPNQPFYRVSEDLAEWSARRALARNLTGGERAIDAALGWAEDRCYLVWKGPDHETRIAVAETPESAFRYVGDGRVSFEKRDGRVTNEGQENYQFHEIDGERYLLTTDFRAGHRPTLYRMDGDPAEEGSWTTWTDGRELEIPERGFNTGDRANAAALYDWREHDGHCYLLYAGNEEGRYDGDTEGPFAGRGWNRLGLARSTDLESWEPA